MYMLVRPPFPFFTMVVPLPCCSSASEQSGRSLTREKHHALTSFRRCVPRHRMMRHRFLGGLLMPTRLSGLAGQVQLQHAVHRRTLEHTRKHQLGGLRNVDHPLQRPGRNIPFQLADQIDLLLAEYFHAGSLARRVHEGGQMLGRRPPRRNRRTQVRRVSAANWTCCPSGRDHVLAAS